MGRCHRRFTAFVQLHYHPGMWAAIAFLSVMLAAGAFRGIAAFREWWLDRRTAPAMRTVKPHRARTPSQPAHCGRQLRHLLLRLFGSEADCRFCAGVQPREPLPLARRGGDDPGPAGGGESP